MYYPQSAKKEPGETGNEAAAQFTEHIAYLPICGIQTVFCVPGEPFKLLYSP